jgi:hypothetical protein
MANNVVPLAAENLPTTLPAPMQFERLAEDATELERRFFDAISGSNKTGKSHCHHRLVPFHRDYDGLF